jgi:peptidoglycan hydrolase-like protein with peptidoglycan-binding domain
LAAIGTGGLKVAERLASAQDGSGDDQSESPAGTLAGRATETVSRRDLVQTEDVDGRLDYGTARSIGGGPNGTITALPAEGTVIDRGQNLWEVDGGPGPALLFGVRPMWRRLSSGVDDGADVRQLEENLIALGFADPTQVTADDHFSNATTQAVKRWQVARGVRKTGAVEAADVLFATGPVRVAEQKATVGASPGAEVLTVTGTEQVVAVKLDTGKASVAKVGQPVTVDLGDRTAKGKVRTVGTVVHTEEGNGGQSTNYLDVVVALDDGKVAGLDDAPVTVSFVRDAAKGVLAVPVRALLALAEGGYALERVAADGVSTALVPVELGATADGYVEVTGDIAEGDTVVVA